jgi:hypothetical protein
LLQLRNKTTHLVRQAAAQELSRTELHPDTMTVYARYVDIIYPANESLFLLALSQRLKGEISVSDFDVQLELAKRWRSPSPAEAEAAAAEAKAERQARKRNKLPDGW